MAEIIYDSQKLLFSCKCMQANGDSIQNLYLGAGFHVVRHGAGIAAPN